MACETKIAVHAFVLIIEMLAFWWCQSIYDVIKYNASDIVTVWGQNIKQINSLSGSMEVVNIMFGPCANDYAAV